MPWDSPLTRWQQEHPYDPAAMPTPENRPAVEKTEKRSITLTDPRFWAYFNLGRQNLANVDVTTESALGVPPFFCALRYISEGVAMLDRSLKRRTEAGVKDADNHPLWDFFLGPCPHPHYTWTNFICALLTNACLGNGYARIHWDYDTMRPMYLEHLPMVFVRPEYDAAGNLWYIVTGDVSGRATMERVPYTDMIHIKGLSLNGILGYDIAWLHESTFAQGIARGDYAESKMGTSVYPSIVVSTDEELDASEIEIREKNLIARVGSAQKAGTPVYLDGGQTLQYFPPPTLDAALQQLANLNVEDVARITKVPRDLLALDTNGTYGAGVQRSKDFLLHCLSPWVEQLQEEFNYKLFYRSESRGRRVYFEFDTSMYVGLDKKAESEMLAAEVAGTIRTINEARAVKGLPAVDGGDELMVNINLLPMSKAVEIALAKYLSAAGEKARGEQEKGESQTDTENGKDAESGTEQ